MRRHAPPCAAMRRPAPPCAAMRRHAPPCAALRRAVRHDAARRGLARCTAARCLPCRQLAEPCWRGRASHFGRAAASRAGARLTARRRPRAPYVGRPPCACPTSPHRYTDIARTADGDELPEHFVDAAVTILAACHDLRGPNRARNSRTGSVYARTRTRQPPRASLPSPQSPRAPFPRPFPAPLSRAPLPSPQSPRAPFPRAATSSSRRCMHLPRSRSSTRSLATSRRCSRCRPTASRWASWTRRGARPPTCRR